MRRLKRPAKRPFSPAFQTRPAARFFRPRSSPAPRASAPRRTCSAPPAARRPSPDTHTTERIRWRCRRAPSAAPQSRRPRAARSIPARHSADRRAEFARPAGFCQTARAEPDTRPRPDCRACVWRPQTARASRKRRPRRALFSSFPKCPAPHRAETIRSARFSPRLPSARRIAHPAVPPHTASRPPVKTHPKRAAPRLRPTRRLPRQAALPSPRSGLPAAFPNARRQILPSAPLLPACAEPPSAPCKARVSAQAPALRPAEARGAVLRSPPPTRYPARAEQADAPRR